MFVNEEKKDSFVKSFSGDLHFFEGSYSKTYKKSKFIRKEYKNTSYLPQYCFLLDPKVILPLLFNFNFWFSKNSSFDVEKIRKVEKVIFKYRDDPYKKKKKFLRFLFLFKLLYAPIYIFKGKRSKAKGGKGDRYYAGMIGQQESELKTAWFNFRFFLGYKYCSYIISNFISENEVDEIYHWGPNWTTTDIVSYFASKYSIPLKHVEYGEIQGAFSINKKGMFGDSDFYESIIEKTKLPLTLDEQRQADCLLKEYSLHDDLSVNVQLITRPQWWSSKRAIKAIELVRNQFDAVVYVSGVELIYSGWLIGADGEVTGNPNERILELVRNSLDVKRYLIIYRDHPLAIKQTPSLLCDVGGMVGVINGTELPFDYVLHIADIVVSAPSKVQLQSLIAGKKVISFGECVAPTTLQVQNFEQINYAYEASSEEFKGAFDRVLCDKDQSDMLVSDYVAYLSRSLMIPLEKR